MYMVLTWSNGEMGHFFIHSKHEVYDFLKEHPYKYDEIMIYQYTDAFDSFIRLKKHYRPQGGNE